ncbi:3'-5' exonuclease [bacterium SCSIO 12741]|nr:3'-5' exonuclease [bacterium SCSIO 12741]
MKTNIPLENILFIDIETVPAESHYEHLSETWKNLWNQKAQYLSRDNESPESLYERAGIYAEFGKVICISVGRIRFGKLRIRSYFGHDERKLLQDFCHSLNRYYANPKYRLCAHNGKEFDFPYLARRILINRLTLPETLDLAGKKPWEVKHLDTLHLWKFGDFKHYTSLTLLAELFGLKSSKSTLDGSQVRATYYEEKDLRKIVHYCEDDVRLLTEIYQNLRPEKQKTADESQVQLRFTA